MKEKRKYIFQLEQNTKFIITEEDPESTYDDVISKLSNIMLSDDVVSVFKTKNDTIVLKNKYLMGVYISDSSENKDTKIIKNKENDSGEELLKPKTKTNYRDNENLFSTPEIVIEEIMRDEEDEEEESINTSTTDSSDEDIEVDDVKEENIEENGDSNKVQPDN